MKRFSKFISESAEINEKLKASDDMGTWVKDFQDSDAPQFKGKSQKKRQQMAIAAKLAAERNEEVELDEKAAIQYSTYKDYVADRKKQGLQVIPEKLWNNLKKNEEVELDEVLDTPKAMDSYKAKAKYSKERAANSAAAKMLRNKNGFHSTDTSQELKTMDKRTKGLKMADKNAMKKTFKALRGEEVERIDELKKSTLASYVNKASDDRAQNALEIGKSGKINFKGLKRRQGIQRATKRLAKEEFELDEAQLDKMKKISPGFDTRSKAELHNDHLVSKKKASHQSYVAKIGNKYHVVDMKEEVELDEAKTDIYHQHMLKALGKSRLPKNHQYTSAIANNGDFVVKDGSGRTVGRIAKGDHNLKD